MTLRFTRLTRPNIRALAIDEKVTEHGIEAERLRDGDVRYSVNIMADGHRVHRVIGRASDGTTRSQCEQFIAKVRSDAKERRLNLPKGRKLALTFAKAAVIYMEHLHDTEGKGIAEKEWHLRLHLVPDLGNMPLDRISKFTLEKYRRSRKAHGLKPSSINRTLATYRHMGNELLELGKISAPLPMIKLEPEDDRRDYVLDAEEKTALLESALDDSNSLIWLFIMIGLHTSLRHAEILSTRFEHFDDRRRRLRVRVKGGRWRDQPLTRKITEILQRERDMAEDPNEWIFPSSRGRKEHVQRMKSAFRRVVIAADLDPKKVTPHTMRHTAITEMAETGAEARTIQAFSGHRSKEMVWRYTHARDERINQALDRFEEEGTKVERMPDRKPRRS